MRVGELTTGEKLYILRKRAEQSMSTAAKQHKTSLNKYRGWERDEVTPEGVGTLALGSLSEQEVFMLHRRRSGLTMAEVAEKIGCCPWWIRIKERGETDNTDLKQLWKMN